MDGVTWRREQRTQQRNTGKKEGMESDKATIRSERATT